MPVYNTVPVLEGGVGRIMGSAPRTGRTSAPPLIVIAVDGDSTGDGPAAPPQYAGLPLFGHVPA